MQAVVDSVRILSSNLNNLSKRTLCLGTSLPIRILRPRQGARRLVCQSHSPITTFLLLATLLGAFGGGNNNPSMFGATKPAAGFGAFGGGGGTTAFGGGGGTFGAAGPSQPAASNTNLFGQPSTSTGAFGAGTFGSKPATSAFGATTCTLEILLYLSVKLTAYIANTNAGPYDGMPPVTTGTSNPPYSVFTEKDSANSTITLQYQSITCMPQYRGNSFEVSHLLIYSDHIIVAEEPHLPSLPASH